jgi:tetratricopeptide (TPR) repeat protein
MTTGAHTSAPPAARVPAVRLFIVIGLLIVALAALDISLRKAEVREVHNSAQSAYENGESLLKAGRLNDAVESFRRAYASERNNTTYELGLIRALMASQRSAEVEPLLRDLLDKAPNNSPANLLEARLLSKQNKRVEAAAYYHRAIYGEWPADAAHQRIAARRELIDFYRSGGQQQEMLSELIPLQEEVGKNVNLQKEIAQLYLQANSPQHAVGIFSDLIKQNPRDAGAYAGRGEAELEGGDYRAAQSDFSAAAARDPQNKEIGAKLSLLREITGLDPTSRRLTSFEKYRRSQLILQMARKSLQDCIARQSITPDGEINNLFSEADKAAPAKKPSAIDNELSEHLLDLAQGLWNARVRNCGSPQLPDGEEALRLIMAKLAQ